MCVCKKPNAADRHPPHQAPHPTPGPPPAPDGGRARRRRKGQSAQGRADQRRPRARERRRGRGQPDRAAAAGAREVVGACLHPRARVEGRHRAGHRGDGRVRQPDHQAALRRAQPRCVAARGAVRVECACVCVLT